MNTSRNIALYHPWIYLKGGAERTIVELTGRSRHNWTILANHFEATNTFPELKKRKVIELTRVPVKRSYSMVSIAAFTILTQRIDLREYDVLIISSEGLGDFVTFRNHNVPVICLCHTPLKVIHDPFTKEKYLETHRSSIFKFAICAAIFKLLDRFAWRYYQYVFVNSQETRKRILKSGLAPSNKIEVTYRGVDTERMRPSWNYERYFLLPGRIMWTKSIELGIEAFKQFQKKNRKFGDFKLVISGMLDEKSRLYYKRLVELSGGSNSIEFVISPSDEKLFELYRECYAVLFTALNEDWGLVPLEGMAFGKPVISVNRGGPTESIINGTTGFLIEPTPVRFAETMKILAKDESLTYEMGREARKRSKKYDWANFVETIDCYIDTLIPPASHVA